MTPPTAPVLSATGLRKSFPAPGGPVEILKGLDVSINAGEFVAVTGASGSGKSTLLALLAGLDRPTEGRIAIDGEPLDSLDEAASARVRRDKIGFVFQSFHLIPSLTVLENVALPLAFQTGGFKSPDAALRLLEAVGMTDRASFLPGKLSGGEQQRAAIARALIHDPRLVFADEPTGNLDSLNGRRVLELLEQHTIRAGRTLVLVTHDPDIAARAHRRLHLVDGKIA